MSNLEPVTLAGKHIQLVPLSLSHLEALCDVGLDPALWRLTNDEVLTKNDMSQYIQTALSDVELFSIIDAEWPNLKMDLQMKLVTFSGGVGAKESPVAGSAGVPPARS